MSQEYKLLPQEDLIALEKAQFAAEIAEAKQRELVAQVAMMEMRLQLMAGREKMNELRRRASDAAETE